MQVVFGRMVVKWIAGGLPFLLCGVPLAIGVCFACDPLSRSESREWLPVTSLSDLPADGVPRRFSIYDNPVDAWCRLPQETFDHVFLTRSMETGSIAAFEPRYHGCAIEIDRRANRFFVPCWNLGFDFEGNLIGQGMDLRAPDLTQARIRVVADVISVWNSDLDW
ncbi:MAG: hypothetical protein NT069_23795 [Planctomycetota bacterium]|nr:hypothetical protein [Planctomycetota bacterium]